tara:strand:- start:10 stop:174 length:165 start_codon:yes stop_codon:yes gene_type:complete
MLKIFKIHALLYFWDCSGQFLSRLSNLREVALLVFGQVKAVLTLINNVVIAHNK